MGGSAASAPPVIEVFVDEECLQTDNVINEGGWSSGMQLRENDGKDLKKETDLLRENPLRHFPPTSLKYYNSMQETVSLTTKDPSNFLAHEAAFALGQMQDADAIPALKLVLSDMFLHPIAADALGAIGVESNIVLLKDSFYSDPAQEVRETCELALSRIQDLKNAGVGNQSSEASPFLSVDPAAPASCLSVHQLRLATVSSGAASGELLQYELGGPRVCVQTAYGVEVEVESIPYDPDLMVFMDYRDYTKQSGGSLPNTEQKNLAFGAAASMVHPATGYSVVRSLSEAPNYAAVIAKILKQGNSKPLFDRGRYTSNISKQAWETLWPPERKRQRAFFLFGL